MPTKRTKRTHTPWKKQDAPLHLMSQGWSRVPRSYRENPCHTDELRDRVDALARSRFIGKGEFDPASTGKRARNRWAKAYFRCENILCSPDWWKRNCPEQFAIVDPPSIPGPITIKRNCWGYYVKEFEPVYVKEGYLPLLESEILLNEALWDPDYPDDPVRVAAAQLAAQSREIEKREHKKLLKLLQ